MLDVKKIGIALALVLLSGGAMAGETVQWSELKLVGASGVPTESTHKYYFKGILKIYAHSSSSGFSFSKGFYSSSSYKLTDSFWVEGKGTWKSSGNTAQELLQLQRQGGTDNLSATFKCNGDPWITTQSCVVTNVAFNSGASSGIRDWPGMIKHYARPLTVQVVTLAQATALSKQHQASSPPPPPPPKSNKSGGFSRPTHSGPLTLGKVKPALPRAPLHRAPAGSAKVSTKPSLPTSPADLISGTSLLVGGKKTPWGKTVTLDATAARTRNMNGSGVCEFAIRHSVRNVGLSPSGAFDTQWRNTATHGTTGRSWLPLAAGKQRAETDLLALKPGLNTLSLQIDPMHRAHETNRTNNHYTLAVNLTGQCGTSTAVDRKLRGPVTRSLSAPAKRLQLPSH